MFVRKLVQLLILVYFVYLVLGSQRVVDTDRDSIAVDADDYLSISAEEHYLLGNRYLHLNNPDKAEAHYLHALTINAALPYVHTNLAHLYSRQNRHETALVYFQNAHNLSPTPKTAYNLAVIYQILSNFAASIEYYKITLSLDQKNLNSLYNLGILYQELGNFDEAIHNYLEVCSIAPDSDECKMSRLNYCNIQLVLKEFLEVEECYVKLIQKYSQYTKAIVNLASLYWAKSDEVCLNKEPHSSNEKEDFEQKAIALFQQVISLEPDNIMAKHGLASLTQNTTDAAISLSNQYVKELFDSYSFHFDNSLLNNLQYKSHKVIANAVVMNLRAISDYKVLNILDLGAGTGLVCPEIKNEINLLHENQSQTSVKLNVTAVDISYNMLLKARDKSCYDDIIVSDIFDFMTIIINEEPFQWDVIVAADVLMYFSDLTGVLSLAFQVMRDSGIMVFTVENYIKNSKIGEYDESLEFNIQKSGRYGHSPQYIEKVLTQAGFTTYTISDVVLRLDKSQPVYGLLVVVTK